MQLLFIAILLVSSAFANAQVLIGGNCNPPSGCSIIPNADCVQNVCVCLPGYTALPSRIACAIVDNPGGGPAPTLPVPTEVPAPTLPVPTVSPVKPECPAGLYLTTIACGIKKECPPGDQCVNGRCCSPAPSCCPDGYSFTSHVCINGTTCPGTTCFNGRCCSCHDTPDCPRGMYWAGTSCGPGMACIIPTDACYNGKCCRKPATSCPKPYAYTNDVCTDDKVCPPGTQCIAGRCCRKQSHAPCTKGEKFVDLHKHGISPSGHMDGFAIRYGVGPPQGSIPCSRRAVFRVEFEKLSNDPSLLCYKGKRYCGRRMLRIDLTLSKGPRSGHIIDFGDSISNNGWAGDAGHSDYAAELHGTASPTTSDMAVWSNGPPMKPNGCKAQKLYNSQGSLDASVTKVTVWIANHFIKVTNNQGLNHSFCSKCLYGLNGQPDGRARGTADQYVWIALNRVVWGSRSGYGICSARLKWVENANP